MRGLEKNCMGRGQTDRHTDRQADIATTRKNRPKGRFFENSDKTLPLINQKTLSIPPNICKCQDISRLFGHPSDIYPCTCIQLNIDFWET